MTKIMMKNGGILKRNNNKNKDKKQWLHPPEALQGSHIAYLVKFLGSTEVAQPKGIEVVKEGIRKLKFNAQLKKSEGEKPAKIELTISIDGVAVQEPKSKKILHQYPLHRISYCADDKAEKRFFSFIAKDVVNDRHMCFVFVSDKLAEEITLTIGQAFDLAYKRFLETSGRDLEMRKQMMVLQQRLQSLESENQTLKHRLENLAKYVNKSDMETFLRSNNMTSLVSMNGEVSQSSTRKDSNSLPSAPPVPPRAFETKTQSPAITDDLLGDLVDPPPQFQQTPTVGTKLEGLLLDEFDEITHRSRTGSSPMVNGNGPPQKSAPVISPPPNKGSREIPVRNGTTGQDLFGSQPFSPQNNLPDPFGMGDFSPQELQSAIGQLDKRIAEMKDGFSKGLSIEDEDFSIESLDPLRN